MLIKGKESDGEEGNLQKGKDRRQSGVMYLVNDFCRDVCPYANAEKYPEIKICKILDGLSDKEDCPAHMFARYISHRIACVGINDVIIYPEEKLRNNI